MYAIKHIMIAHFILLHNEFALLLINNDDDDDDDDDDMLIT